MASGWIEHDASGYKAVVRMANGRRRSKRFPKKMLAKAWLSEMQAAVDRGTFIDPRLGRTTFEDWSTTFRASEAHTLRATSLDLDERTYRNHILPVFGKQELGKITATDVQDWVNDLIAQGLAPSTISKYYIILAKPLAAAVEAGVLVRSPCGKWIKRPTIEYQEMRFLTPERVSALAGAIAPRYRALVFVAAYGGLRIGELAGLRRVSIDGANVIVREQATEGAKLVFGPPKTSRGRRTVPLPARVVEILTEHLKKYIPDEPDAFVFGGAQGSVLRAHAWRIRVLAPAATAAKLGHVAPHDLRHTAIAIWIAAGISPKEIADRAGHSSVAVVLDRYGHLFPDASDSFRERVGELFVP